MVVRASDGVTGAGWSLEQGSEGRREGDVDGKFEKLVTGNTKVALVIA